jgi:hypothetical protein
MISRCKHLPRRLHPDWSRVSAKSPQKKIYTITDRPLADGFIYITDNMTPSDHFVFVLHSLLFCACSQPVQQLLSGCYNFCRFALLEPGQTSSSCCCSQQPDRPSTVQQQADEPAQVVVDGFDSFTEPVPAAADAAVGIEGVCQSVQQQQQQSAAAAVGLLSQQLRQQQLPAQPGAHPVAAAAEGRTPGETGPDDLTEAAEEQMMLRNAAPSSSNYSSSTTGTSTSPGCLTSTAAAAGPCYLALPSDDPANLGIWQLGGEVAAAGAGGGQQPLMLLKQSKGPDRPHRGQCMAVVLLQPQVC